MPAHIPATSRTMAVFEIFAREKRELTKRDMARLLSVADSSCSDLLHTLHELGYLVRTPKTRRYYPSMRLNEMARQIAENDPLASVAQEAVTQLAERTNESAFFGVLEPLTVKVAAAQFSRRPLRFVIEVGHRFPLHASALGKALLGLLPPEELPTLIEKLKLEPPLTAGIVVNVDDLLGEVTLSRERGWYEARSEADRVAGLAVSGWLGGLPVGISVGGPSDRIDEKRDEYLEALRDVRDALLSDG